MINPQKMLDYCQKFILKHAKTDIRGELAVDADNWRNPQKGRVGIRSPVELNVLILSGPNPINDLTLLRDLGVPPENIWAIEGDKEVFQHAVKNLLDAQLPIKLHHGSLQEFLELVPQQFDLVYFDSCSPACGRSLREVHAAQERLESRLGPQRIKPRQTEICHGGISYLQALFKPTQSLNGFPGTEIQTGNVERACVSFTKARHQSVCSLTPVLEKMVSVAKKVVYGTEKMLSVSEKMVSAAEIIISTTEKTVSLVEIMVSTTEKIVSMTENIV